MAESWNETFKDWPIEGPSASFALAKHIARQQQLPTAWFESWARSKHVASSDRTYHEVLVPTEAPQGFGCYEKLNLGSSAELDSLVRRALIVMEAHGLPGERPNYDLAPYFAGAAASSDPMPRPPQLGPAAGQGHGRDRPLPHESSGSSRGSSGRGVGHRGRRRPMGWAWTR